MSAFHEASGEFLEKEARKESVEALTKVVVE
jgi:hypothetical protein